MEEAITGILPRCKPSMQTRIIIIVHMVFTEQLSHLPACIGRRLGKVTFRWGIPLLE